MLLDIGLGILIPLGLAKGLALPFTDSFVLWGIAFFLLPDIDFVFHMLRGRLKNHDHKHREGLHYPILFLIIGLVICFYSLPYGLLFLLCTMAHFIHDSIGIGWGIQWFYPISKNYYIFFYHYSLSAIGHLPNKAVRILTPQEKRILEEKYADNNWFKNVYLKFHPYAIVELVVFLVAMVVWFFNQ